MSTARTKDQFPLSHLLKELRQETYSYTSLSVLGLLARTSKQCDEDTAFLRLLSAAVDAEPESYTPDSYLKDKARVAATPTPYQIPDETKLAAIAILKSHPKLLFELLFWELYAAEHKEQHTVAMDITK